MLMANSACRAFLGVEAGFDPAGKTAWDVYPRWQMIDVHGRPLTLHDLAMMGTLDGGATHTIELGIVRSDRTLRWALVSLGPAGAPDGTIIGVVVTWTDITALRQARDELERGRTAQENVIAVLRSTLDASADGILIVGLDGRFQEWNQRFSVLWNIPPEILALQEPHTAMAMVLDRVVDARCVEERTHWLMAHPQEEGVDIIELRDGRFLERHSKPHRVGGEIAGRLWSFRDITERRRKQARLEHLAFHDPLTGLPNRALFADRLEQAIVRGSRDRTKLALLYLDLDHFKAINDRFGHATGDRVLLDAVRRVRGCLRSCDTLSRLGGDEFLVMLPVVEGRAGADVVARRILQALSGPLLIEDFWPRISCSIGVALYPDDAQEPDVLIHKADAAMYLAKGAGRDTVRFAGDALSMLRIDPERG
jgi:diguanylate cyclase (GGDEF)-like protein/PAS domain S-box-containing protein